ncbi:MAG: hypothetical protein AAFX06_15935 [Planctomycetota bacterium]
MDCTSPTSSPSRAQLRIAVIGLILTVVSLTGSRTAFGQYSSAGIDLREHRSTQHTYAVGNDEATPVSHEGLRQFTPNGHEIQAIKKGRLNHRDSGGFTEQQYYRNTYGPETQGLSPNDPRQASFIERERSESAARETAQELIMRIGINLGFVLALGIGGVLIYKQVQRGKPAAIGDLQELKVCQTLRLTTGASIYVVEGFGKKFLVAIDANGIKSVEVLNASFHQTMEQAEPYEDLELEDAVASFARGQREREVSPRGKRARRREQQEQARREREEPTSELDAKLINLLLQRTKQAA